jgi:hypothetical protein
MAEVMAIMTFLAILALIGYVYLRDQLDRNHKEILDELKVIEQRLLGK